MNSPSDSRRPSGFRRLGWADNPVNETGLVVIRRDSPVVRERIRT